MFLKLGLALLVVWVLADRLTSKNSSVEVAQESREITPVAIISNPTPAAQLPAAPVLTAEANIESRPNIETRPATTASAKPDMVDAEWVTRLNPEHFIVQYGSTVDLELIEEFVPVINSSEEIAIYPFKKTPSGRLVYGIATGVYDDLDNALESVEKLSAEARAYNPWVRPVDELIEQIGAVGN